MTATLLTQEERDRLVELIDLLNDVNVHFDRSEAVELNRLYGKLRNDGDAPGDEFRQWWRSISVDVRDIPPPPGACTGRIHRDGDPSTPCVLAAGHAGEHEDPEGYCD